MRSFFRPLVWLILGIALVGYCVGCGSANNDQGVSFTAIGFYFWDPADQECDPDIGVTGMSIPMSVPTETLGSDRGAGLACLRLQNSMSQVFIRTERLFYDFYVEGASTQPPSTALPFGAVLAPLPIGSGGEEGGGESFDSSLPESFAAVENGNVVDGQVLLVPAEIQSWINLNRGSLPEAPFSMVVSINASGLTSAGDRLESNKVDIFVTITPDVVIPPTAGTGSGLGGTDEATEE